MRKAKTRRRASGPRRKRRQKTLAEVLELQEGEVWVDENSGLYLYMESTRLWTGGELIAKFYEANHELNPITFTLVEDLGHAWAEKDWYAIMYRGWHIRIIKGSETCGPHQTQLWFKPQLPAKPWWIASLQLMGFFYNEEEMKAALLLAIAQKEFYMTDDDRDVTIAL